MNPNTAQSLDPKLKEAYDRVMGTQVNFQAQPKPATPPQSSKVGPSPSSSPAPTATEPEMVSINTTAPIAKPAPAKGKISPIIFVVLGVGFFLFYTVLWLKVFKIF